MAGRPKRLSCAAPTQEAPSNRYQISDFSNSNNRRNTHLHVETLQLSSKALQRSPEVAALMGGLPEWLLPTIPVHHLLEVSPVWGVDRC